MVAPALILAVALAPPAAAADDPAGSAGAGSDDPVLKALADELDRSMTLQLEDLEQPYFIQYDVEDSASYRISATCGALVASDSGRSRTLFTQVRVGSYELDNTNFGGGGGQAFGRRGGGRGRGGSGGGGAVPLPVDDDYLAIRQAVWAATDGEYKSAVETLTRKRAYMEDRDFAGRPPDFTKVEPVQSIKPKADLPEFDRAAWKDRLGRISARFLDYPTVQSSGADLTVASETTYLVNSEGTRLRSGNTRTVLRINAELQASNGRRLSDSRTYYASTPADLPDVETILDDVDGLVKCLSRAAKAPKLEDYTGPVLFDEEAAPQLFNALLARGVAASPSEVGEGRRRFAAMENLEKYLDKRILPKSFQVYDDPGVERTGGTLLAGHYVFDDDGVRAQRVDLVKDGKLRAMLASRTPTKDSPKSNGHGRRSGRGDAQAAVGCLFVESGEGMAPEDLKKALIEAAEDEDLDYAIRITSIGSRAAGLRGGFNAADIRAFMSRRMGEGGSNIGDPLYVYKVYVKDGREEPVRDCEFGTIDVDMLRRIVAAGDTPHVYNRGGAMGQASATVVAPAVILEGIDLFGIQEERERLPFLDAPHARNR